MSNRLTTEERLGQSSPRRLMRYFFLIMTLVYIALGVYLWLVPVEALNLAPSTQKILGGVFVFYGILRFVRTYRQYFPSPSSDHDRPIR